MRLTILAASAAFFLAIPASADFIEFPVAGQYELTVQIASSEELSQLCVDRVDVTPVEEIVCVQMPTPFAAGSIHDLTVTIPVTAGLDGQIRAYVVDLSDNRSAYSADAALIDFTIPEAPLLLP